MISKSACLLAFGLASLSLPALAADANPVRVEGSSAGLAISRAAATEFRKVRSSVSVHVGLSGTGGALARFCRGEVDLVHGARSISKSEIETCQKSDVPFVELPLAFDALTVVVNPKNTFVKRLTFAELRAMWQESAQGKVVSWHQINPQFPDAPLKLLAPDRQFEASDSFARAILGSGQSVRRDTMASVDEDVLIRAVARDRNALSYVSWARYQENRAALRAIPIVRNETANVSSSEVVASGEYRLLSRPLFLYVNLRSLARADVAAFTDFYADKAGSLAGSAGYVPLDESTYRLGRERLRRRITGSIWNGELPAGLTAEEIQKREAL